MSFFGWIESYLANRLGELFGLEYDLLLYDVTSTYFEGECAKNAQAVRGYSWDHRGDCKQVTIALVVSRCGIPLGYIAYLREGGRRYILGTPKSDLSLRPIWRQKKERVHAHILVCFLAYVLWKTLARQCSASGLGDEPRKVLDEIAQIQMVDVVLPTKSGIEIRRRCVARPTKHQAILLQHLRLNLPTNLKAAQNVAQTSQAQTANPRSKSALLPG